MMTAEPRGSVDLRRCVAPALARPESKPDFTAGERHKNVTALSYGCAKALFNLNGIIFHHHENVILLHDFSSRPGR